MLKLFLVFLVAFWYVLPVLSDGLSDDPVVTDALQYLDGSDWVAFSSGGLMIGATVPGDLITDLQRANVIGDPLFETTWIQNASLWDEQDWQYVQQFDVDDPAWLDSSEFAGTLLVLDGVKMVADVQLNGVSLGTASDQFLRYWFDVQSVLRPQNNKLVVSFAANDTRIDPEVRFMACAGGVDWAPYSNPKTGVTPGGVRTLGKGIWKSVYLAAQRRASTYITYIVPQSFYTGPYPTAPLTPSTMAPFNVTVRIHFYCADSNGTQGTVRATLLTGGATEPTAEQNVALPPGDSNVTLSFLATSSDVQLWWPAGLGSQPLYMLNVTFNSSSGISLLSGSRRLGFRVFVLVTDDDSVPAQLQTEDGSGNLTMRFRVNGANMYARGGNWVPMDVFDGRYSAIALYTAIQSAAAAGMNTLRLWGGGVFERDALYDACDELGLLMYHDLMYCEQADSFHMAAPTEMQRDEAVHQLRRLSAHPSIALWDGCNECGGSGVYESFLLPLIAAEQPSRALWPSCPSSGFQSGISRLWSLPWNAFADTGRHNLPHHHMPSPVPTLSILAMNVALNRTADGVVCQQGGRYRGFPLTPFLIPFPTANASECLRACEEWGADCMVGQYQDGGCQLKGFEYMVPTFLNWTVWDCFPPRNNASVSPPPVPMPPLAEQHGPYTNGGGWPMVNTPGPGPFPSLLPPVFVVPPPPPSAYGTKAPGIFTSEFGVGTWSSFESVSPTLAATHYGMHGGAAPPDECSAGWYHICTGSNPMAQRNYACDTLFDTYFGSRPTVTLSDSSPAAFRAQLYLCMMSSLLLLKSTVEQQRATNIWGLLTWQLNEIWPTGGWGSLEYGNVGFTAGQVVGGRWKPTHHLYERVLLRDVFAACDVNGQCFVKNDNALQPFEGQLQLAVQHLTASSSASSATSMVNEFDDGVVFSTVQTAVVSLPIGANAIQWFCAANVTAGSACPPLSAVLPTVGCAANGSDCVLWVRVLDSNGSALFENPSLLITPGNLTTALPQAHVFVSFPPAPPPAGAPITLTVHSDAAALFVTLTTLAQGRFSDNVLMLARATDRALQFVPFDGFDYEELVRTTRVDHLAMYLQ